MTVEFVQPETQDLIEERMALGHFSDVESVVLDALRKAPSPQPVTAQQTGQSLLDVFAELREILDGQELDLCSDWRGHSRVKADPA